MAIHFFLVTKVDHDQVNQVGNDTNYQVIKVNHYHYQVGTYLLIKS